MAVTVAREKTDRLATSFLVQGVTEMVVRGKCREPYIPRLYVLRSVRQIQSVLTLLGTTRGFLSHEQSNYFNR